jgi:predicted nucleic acid-binding protein
MSAVSTGLSDDLSIGRNRLEAEAILQILRQVEGRTRELVGSEAVDAELSLTPSSERQAKTKALAQLRSSFVRAGSAERARALAFVALGLRYMDALHVACAESGRCDILLTTDDQFLAKAREHASDIMVRVANPLEWMTEVSAL